ncbi:ABC-2 transporter permease [Lactobacillus sp. M0398]|uniref:ABC-2 transporter permease n=1 Tax=unclassified Lactobacillus TaxID=2620435 RepID=UPI0018DDE78E|nr:MULTISPECIES: ABC-2 transporter permease [unclassified Lactobacillus]MBI0121867.1 ABC-2 transporter permease [Lactobacillus sp. M0398]MBI0123794.1 ABC-2 transporter permease [Lactobacillus sp. W8174]MBI0135912.1 ABC-2 transporter permease [Lactobacillus sp. W8173]
MRGLLYKDFQLILNKLSVKSRLLIILVLLLVTIFGRESGTIFLSIMGPIGLASIPTGLLVADQESGWNRFVGVFPIPKRNIVLARYIFCISLIVFISFITLILSIATALIFQQFSLQIHIIISIVGLLIGIMYVVLLLPAVYASGTFGSTIVNILVLVLIMGGVYILQKTTLGLLFITWISNTNAFVLIVTSCFLIAVISIVSMIISTKVYSNTFE